MAAARNYSSVARATTLTGSVNGSATVIPVTETTGFPTVPFTLVLDPARTVEEAVTVTNIVGLNLTVVRGVDGTAASPHDAGATVRHMATARDFREAAEHIGATADVHGVAGELLGITAAQVVDNKTFMATGNHTPLIAKASGTQTVDIFQVQNNAGTKIAGVTVAGRIDTPGINGSNTSTFTSGASGTVPLIAKGAPAQVANLISARDAADIELMHVGFDGTLQARSTAVSGDLVVSNTTTLTDEVTTHSSFHKTTEATQSPLTVQTYPTSSAAAIAVIDPATVPVAGVRGSVGSWQLYHGGDASNVVPFKIHTGTISCTITAGNTSIGGHVDFSSYGWAAPPHVQLTVRQFEESTLKRRVAVTLNDPTTSGFDFRVHQTAAETVPDNTNYTVYWMAIQMTPTVSNG